MIGNFKSIMNSSQYLTGDLTITPQTRAQNKVRDHFQPTFLHFHRINIIFTRCILHSQTFKLRKTMQELDHTDLLRIPEQRSPNRCILITAYRAVSSGDSYSIKLILNSQDLGMRLPTNFLPPFLPTNFLPSFLPTSLILAVTLYIYLYSSPTKKSTFPFKISAGQRL